MMMAMTTDTIITIIVVIVIPVSGGPACADN